MKAEYIEAMAGQITLAKWRKVVNKALDDAIAGDRHARRFLADYLMGKPPQILELHNAEAAKLAEILRLLEEQGWNESDLFDLMLQKLNTEEKK